jgi:hypothetical protein
MLFLRERACVGDRDTVAAATMAAHQATPASDTDRILQRPFHDFIHEVTRREITRAAEACRERVEA